MTAARRLTTVGWLVVLVTAWFVAYGLYFGVLLLIDTWFGGQHWQSEWLFESRQQLILRMLDVIAASAWLILPAVALAVLIALLEWGGPSWRPALMRALTVAAAGGIGAGGFGIAAGSAVLFGMALFGAAVAAWWVARALREHADA
ncbi:MAG: hypothetical protein ACFCUJ_04075 [Thiotrichales bacterium]